MEGAEVHRGALQGCTRECRSAQEGAQGCASGCTGVRCRVHHSAIVNPLRAIKTWRPV